MIRSNEELAEVLANQFAQTYYSENFSSRFRAFVTDILDTMQARLFVHDGTPDDAAQATLTLDPDGDENSLVFTSVAYGEDANKITIAYVDPDAEEAELSVDVTGTAITVSLATDEEGEIVTTAAEVLAAIEGDEDAAALVTVEIDDTDADSEPVGDGSGVVTAMAAAPLAGGEGTAIGKTLPGGLLIDTANGLVYRNSGSTAVPAWTQLGDDS